MTLLVMASKFEFQTSRLEIKPLCREDKTLYIKLYTNERVMRFIMPALSLEKAEESFNNALKLNADTLTKRLFLTVRLLQEHIPSALCCISNLDRKNNIAEIGNLVLPEAQGKRIAQEATTALIKQIQQLLAIDHFVMDISKDNLPAIRAAKSIGFQPDCHNPTLYYLNLKRDNNDKYN